MIGPIDTGLTYTWIPASVALDLGISPVEIAPLYLADGRRIRRRVGEVRLRVLGREATRLIVFARKSDANVVGVDTLQGFAYRSTSSRTDFAGARVRWRLRPMLSELQKTGNELGRRGIPWSVYWEQSSWRRHAPRNPFLTDARSAWGVLMQDTASVPSPWLAMQDALRSLRRTTYILSAFELLLFVVMVIQWFTSGFDLALVFVIVTGMFLVAVLADLLQFCSAVTARVRHLSELV